MVVQLLGGPLDGDFVNVGTQEDSVTIGVRESLLATYRKFNCRHPEGELQMWFYPSTERERAREIRENIVNGDRIQRGVYIYPYDNHPLHDRLVELTEFLSCDENTNPAGRGTRSLERIAEVANQAIADGEDFEGALIQIRYEANSTLNA